MQIRQIRSQRRDERLSVDLLPQLSQIRRDAATGRRRRKTHRQNRQLRCHVDQKVDQIHRLATSRPPHFDVSASADVRQFVRRRVRRLIGVRLFVRRQRLDRPKTETDSHLGHPRSIDAGSCSQTHLLQSGNQLNLSTIYQKY